MKTFTLVVMILLARVMAPAQTATYEDARAAIQKRDFATALRILRPLADQGVARAQSTLGGMYASGLGVARSYEQGVAWFQKAATQGFAEAQSNLGVAYATGQGITKNDTAALYWFRKSAEQGYAAGQFLLGQMYRNGTGVAKSSPEALYWFRKSADQAFSGAITALGEMYDTGEGVPKDSVEAYKWLVIAAVQGNEEAKQYIAGVDGRLTPKEVDEAKKAAQEWVKSHQK